MIGQKQAHRHYRLVELRMEDDFFAGTGGFIYGDL
jgi:hypothetical protein